MTRPLRGVCVAVVVGAVVLGLVVSALIVIGLLNRREPAPPPQRCMVTADDRSVGVDFAQAHYASVIAGVAVRRGLPARAASIALTTAFAESNLHNLDHGDRDSVGLFQQRPSQGWGTKKQIMDPVYATNQFYDRLIKIENWESVKISTIAQRIQISAVPRAYREHESDGRALGSVLTGRSSAGISCLIRDRQPRDTDGLARALHKTYKIEPKRSRSRLVITARSRRLAWSYAQFAVANARDYGLRSAQVGDRRWTLSKHRLADWKAASSVGNRTVRLTLGPS